MDSEFFGLGLLVFGRFRKHGKDSQKHFFWSLRRSKRLFTSIFLILVVVIYVVFLSKLATYHYNKRKLMLLGKEREVYNALIENSYNPFTIYRWALLERVPEEIKFQLRNHYLSQKKATRLSFERRHETNTSLQVEIRRLGLQLIKEM